MYVTLFILFFIVVVLAFVEDYIDPKYKTLILGALCVGMILIAATKDIENTTDCDSYEEIFLNNDDELLEIATEPTYIYLSRAMIALGISFPIVFLIYALISVPPKMLSMHKLTPYSFTALMIFIPVYYELQDLVQIRAAAAAAFGMMAIKPIGERRYWRAFGLCICAILFHYSSVVFLPFLLLTRIPFNRIMRIILMSVPFIGFAMHVLGLDLLSFVPSSLIGGKVDFYREAASSGTMWDESLNPFKDLYLLTKCMVFLFMLIFYGFIKEKSPYIPTILWFVAGSIFLRLSLSTIPVLAGRTSDMLGIADPFMFSYLLFAITPRYAARTCILLLGLYMMMYNMTKMAYFG